MKKAYRIILLILLEVALLTAISISIFKLKDYTLPIFFAVLGVGLLITSIIDIKKNKSKEK
ncbi:MAG: hypothetical protein OCD02_00195 [Spirochaetaceae bacterium]